MILLSVLGELILNHNFLHCMEKSSIMNIQQNIYVCILPKKVRHKCELINFHVLVNYSFKFSTKLA